MDTSAVARVRVTVLPLMTGAVALSVTVSSVLPTVFLTVKALLPREAAAARVSSKVMTREAPFAAADSNAGAVVSADSSSSTVTTTLAAVTDP